MLDYFIEVTQSIPKIRPTTLVVAAIGGALVFNWIWFDWISIVIGGVAGIFLAAAVRKGAGE